MKLTTQLFQVTPPRLSNVWKAFVATARQGFVVHVHLTVGLHLNLKKSEFIAIHDHPLIDLYEIPVKNQVKILRSETEN